MLFYLLIFIIIIYLLDNNYLSEGFSNNYKKYSIDNNKKLYKNQWRCIISEDNKALLVRQNKEDIECASKDGINCEEYNKEECRNKDYINAVVTKDINKSVNCANVEVDGEYGYDLDGHWCSVGDESITSKAHSSERYKQNVDVTKFDYGEPDFTYKNYPKDTKFKRGEWRCLTPVGENYDPYSNSWDSYVIRQNGSDYECLSTKAHNECKKFSNKKCKSIESFQDMMTKIFDKDKKGLNKSDKIGQIKCGDIDSYKGSQRTKGTGIPATKDKYSWCYNLKDEVDKVSFSKDTGNVKAIDGLTIKKDSWRCMNYDEIDKGTKYLIREKDGDVQCDTDKINGGENNYKCSAYRHGKCQKRLDEINKYQGPEKYRPVPRTVLSCGNDNKNKYLVSGYDISDHWCSIGRKRINDDSTASS